MRRSTSCRSCGDSAATTVGAVRLGAYLSRNRGSAHARASRPHSSTRVVVLRGRSIGCLTRACAQPSSLPSVADAHCVSAGRAPRLPLRRAGPPDATNGCPTSRTFRVCPTRALPLSGGNPMSRLKLLALSLVLGLSLPAFAAAQEAAPPAPAQKAATAATNLNTATVADLQKLPGIGAATAT